MQTLRNTWINAFNKSEKKKVRVQILLYFVINYIEWDVEIIKHNITDNDSPTQRHNTFSKAKDTKHHQTRIVTNIKQTHSLFDKKIKKIRRKLDEWEKAFANLPAKKTST